MIELNILANGECELNGEIIRPAKIEPINEFYRIETREGFVASYKVPFNAVRFEGSVLVVAEPKHDKRMNAKIKKLLGVGNGK